MDENREIVARIRAGIDTAANMLQLWENLKGLIHSVAWKYKAYAELEDLEQEGYLALNDAVFHYDPDAGSLFSTYAYQWIKQGIHRYVQNNARAVRIPVGKHEQIMRLRKVREQFLVTHGRHANRWQLANMLGVDPESIDEMLQLMRPVSSLDEPLSDSDDDFTLADTLSGSDSVENDIVEEITNEELKAALWQAVDELEGIQPVILRKQYIENMKVPEISQELGCDVQQVRTQADKGMKMLRKQHRRFAGYLPEYERIYVMGLSGNGVGLFDQTWTSSTERAALRLAERNA